MFMPIFNNTSTRNVYIHAIVNGSTAVTIEIGVTGPAIYYGLPVGASNSTLSFAVSATCALTSGATIGVIEGYFEVFQLN